MITPSEAIERGFMMEGEAEEDARRLARTALGSLVAAGWVLQARAEPLSAPTGLHSSDQGVAHVPVPSTVPP